MSRRQSGRGGHCEYNGLERQLFELIPLKQKPDTIENQPDTHRLLSPDTLPTEFGALSFAEQFGITDKVMCRLQGGGERQRAEQIATSPMTLHARKHAPFRHTQTIKLPKLPSYKQEPHSSDADGYIEELILLVA